MSPEQRAAKQRARTPTAEVEAAVLRAAAELLASEGPSALSIRRIANRAGVAPMSLYNRFDGKQEIVGALFRRGFERLAEALTGVPAGPPRQRLAESGHRYRAFALAEPTTYAVMFERVVPEFEPDETTHAVADSAFGALINLVVDAQAIGDLAAGEPADIAQQLWDVCHGAVSLELRGIGYVEDRAAHFERLIETILTGLAPQT